MVAVDGVGGAGKTTFARALAEAIRHRPVILLHADDFLNPASTRHSRGPNSAEGFWLDAYNYPALLDQTLLPLRSGAGTYAASAIDHATGEATEPDLMPAPPDAVIITEGTFLLRDKLVDVWDHSIYLDVDLNEATRRLAQRNKISQDSPKLARYTGAQRRYFAEAQPWLRASTVIDISTPWAPREIPAEAARAATDRA
ncbi:nucleoside/nucleotide kinase family protein [Parenemella sanctibonifatiensis]|uniref:Uridine kinase n=1 Tax=Parenemella sanctibonifatiensis TaxID=2016505 RepID=A0A255EHL9_9ACTN|nr:hypothetical protein [Parenemella sanctibonifatiensis]OYN90471.1 uridine kinase [Parenemella sanctibonifatiensis]